MEVLLLTHAAHEGPGFFGNVLSEHGTRVRSVALDDTPEARPELGSADLIIAMGGTASAHGEAAPPWLAWESETLAAAARQGRKVLAICLGAQILARGLGSEIHPGTAPEIGYAPVELTDQGNNDPILAGLRSPETVLHWHHDTFDLPKGAIQLASSDLTPNQAFRLGRHAYGLQFHLEIGAEMMAGWLETPGAQRDLAAPGAPTREELLAGAAEREKRNLWLCSSILNRLFNIL